MSRSTANSRKSASPDQLTKKFSGIELESSGAYRAKSTSPSRRRSDFSNGADEEQSNATEIDESDSYRLPSFVLLVLYTLQGIPMGVTSVVPLLLKERGASYTDLANFMICGWPFTCKILWAPFVDARGLFGQTYDKRKSWIIACNLIIAGMLFGFSDKFSAWLTSLEVGALTAVSFLLYFVTATQDIAVDGWALEILPPKWVGLAGTVNTVGLGVGHFVALNGFIYLNSRPEFKGTDILPSSMRVWAVVFCVVTVLFAVLYSPRVKKEKTSTSLAGAVSESYRDTFKLFKNRNFVCLALLLVTLRVPFIDTVISVYTQDQGMSKESIALIGALITPLAFVVPFYVSRHMGSIRQSLITRWSRAIHFKFLSVVASSVVVYLMKSQIPSVGTDIFATPFLIMLGLAAFKASVGQSYVVMQMALCAKVSDPRMGGTYMTALNSISNIGSMLAEQVSMRSMTLVTALTAGVMDPLLAMTFVAMSYYVAWTRVTRPTVDALNVAPQSAWRIATSENE